MSLKKRMFRSNMTILFAALCSLLAVLLGVLIVFEDSIEENFFSAGQSRLDSNLLSMVSAMDRWPGTKNLEGLEQEAMALGYEITVTGGERPEDQNRDRRLDELAALLETEPPESSDTELFYYHNATIAAKYVPEEGCWILAACFPKENWLEASLRQSLDTFILATVLIGLGAIIVLLWLSSVFTGKMNRIIMEPLEELVKGARRIQEGNLKDPVCYRGEKEFEDVCQAFNSMQETILEDQKQRMKTERARIDMVTGISHDLRTPLTSIQGYIKGILDGIADTEEKKQRYLRTAFEATGDMNRLLQKLFDFSRLESGQMPFYMVRADLGELLASCIAQKEAQLDQEEVQIAFLREQEILPEIFVDVEQFRRIFDNLMENSRKYAKACPVKITIRIFQKDSSVFMEWKDNGPGVEKEKLPLIFDRFYRCDEARNSKGSGVGLYVVKYIVERHGGEVWAENEGGLKLTFRFSEASKEA